MLAQEFTPFSNNIIGKYNAERASSMRHKLCHAPFQSLYFGRDGKVTACCYNRNVILGSYPKQNLLDIWQGEVVQKMRAEISEATFATGCDYCGNQLEAGNFGGLHARSFDHYALKNPTNFTTNKNWLKGKVAGFYKKMQQISFSFKKKLLQDNTISQPFPRALEFELSNLCNLECAMCFGEFSSSIRKNRENLPALPMYYDEDFVQQLEIFIPHLREAKFFGGEPFLVPIYYEIWERIMELNPATTIHITTNATILNEKVKRVLEKLNVVLILSIDSFQKETYEKIRVNAQFERVMEHLDYFEKVAKQKQTPFSIAVCPTIHNWKEIPAMVQRCNESSFYIYFNTVWFPFELSLRSLPDSVLQEIIIHYEDFIKNSNCIHSIGKHNFNILNGLIQQLKKWQALLRQKEFRNKERVTKIEEKLKLLKNDSMYQALQSINQQLENNQQNIDFQLLKQEAMNRNNTQVFVRDYFLTLMQGINAYMEEKDVVEINEAMLLRIDNLCKNLLLQMSQKEIMARLLHNDPRHTGIYIINTQLIDIQEPEKIFLELASI